MTKTKSRQKQAKVLRLFRKVHKTTGAILFIFFFVISISGVLLGWKNNSNGFILPNTTQGTTNNLKNWLPIDSLYTNAIVILKDSISPDLSVELDRIDIRKNNGIVKFIFVNHYWEIQLDGATGKLLNIEKRHSDLIEDIHDATILDLVFNTSQKQIKLIYTLIMGLALLLFTVTGFWLWYSPKRMKRRKRQIK